MYDSRQHPASTGGPAEQNHIHTNGTRSNPRQYYPTSPNGPRNESDMYSYPNNTYAFGQSQPQQQQHQANQLPPMHRMQPLHLHPAGGGHPTMAPPPAPGMPGSSSTISGLQGSTSNMSSTLYSAASSASATQVNQDAALQPYSGNNGTYKYELRVEQQPQRARMCGFGDKDRRPITPPPCIRLIITELETGIPVHPEHVDGTFFVLQVDLWDSTGQREVNLVRSSSTSPAVSISTATTTSYPPTTPDRPLANDYSAFMYGPQDTKPMHTPHGYPMTMGHPSLSGYQNVGYYQANPYGNVPAPFAPPTPVPQPGQQPNHNMFTRNLIGSLTVNASLLKDSEDQPGYWFVLQDLSVRTEGSFRLKMNFIDVGAADGSGLNKMRAPVLAHTHSEPFTVYSAKKFPGVIESTPLSKCFAQQGIKIPIRKDAKSGLDGDDDE